MKVKPLMKVYLQQKKVMRGFFRGITKNKWCCVIFKSKFLYVLHTKRFFFLNYTAISFVDFLEIIQFYFCLIDKKHTCSKYAFPPELENFYRIQNFLLISS